MCFSVGRGTGAIDRFEDFGEVVVVLNAAFDGDLVDGKGSGGQKFAGVGESAFFDIFCGCAAKILVTDVVDLVT